METVEVAMVEEVVVMVVMDVVVVVKRLETKEVMVGLGTC